MKLKRSFAPAAAALALLIGSAATVTFSASADVTYQSDAYSIYKPTGSQRYTYAPSTFVDSGVKYIFTCENATNGEIVDHIFLTKLIASTNAFISSGSVLEGDHTPGNKWDSYHNCDPSIVKMNTQYNGTSYTWALFYLGTPFTGGYNAIGVAVSNSPDGPFVKYPNPVVPFDLNSVACFSGSQGRWGYGQPSVTVQSPSEGTALLFYTKDTTCEPATRATFDGAAMSAWVLPINLSNLNSYTQGTPTQLSTAGLTGVDGKPDWLNNFDMAYDATNSKFVAVREMHPYPTPDPWYIGQSVQIDTIDATALLAGGGTWVPEGEISPASTGLFRNHNSGLVRTVYGSLPSSGQASVVFTRSDADGATSSLWSYELWQADLTVSSDHAVSDFYMGESQSGGNTDLFARGSNAALKAISHTGGAWGTWTDLGGVITAAPSVVSTGTSSLDVFVRGDVGQVNARSRSGGSWSSWGDVGAPSSGAIIGAPAAVSRTAGTEDVFVRGGDDGLWVRGYSSGSWGYWQSLGGALTAAPAVASMSSTREDVIVRGITGGLWQKTYSAGTWSGWVSIGQPAGLVVRGAPAVVSRADETLDVFIRASDDQLWERSYAGGIWGSWLSLGGILSSSPSASSSGSSNIHVTVRGEVTSQIWERIWNGSTWSAWAQIANIP